MENKDYIDNKIHNRYHAEAIQYLANAHPNDLKLQLTVSHTVNGALREENRNLARQLTEKEAELADAIIDWERSEDEKANMGEECRFLQARINEKYEEIRDLKDQKFEKNRETQHLQRSEGVHLAVQREMSTQLDVQQRTIRRLERVHAAEVARLRREIAARDRMIDETRNWAQAQPRNIRNSFNGLPKDLKGLGENGRRGSGQA